jgi:hypothetical protein
LKELKDLSDRETVKRFKFDVQLQYALETPYQGGGIEDIQRGLQDSFRDSGDDFAIKEQSRHGASQCEGVSLYKIESCVQGVGGKRQSAR